MSKEKPLSEPAVDKDGRIYADEGPSHYIAVELPDGNERISTRSNAIFMLHSLAESFSTKVPGFTKTVRIVRGDTHEAVFRYREGKGLQEDWEESDFKGAGRRRHARENREEFVSHQEISNGKG